MSTMTVDPSSATAKDSFHGTGVSLVQHPSHINGGTDRGVPIICQGGSSTKSLPSAYTMVRPAAIKTKCPGCTRSSETIQLPCN